MVLTLASAVLPRSGKVKLCPVHRGIDISLADENERLAINRVRTMDYCMPAA